MKDGYYTSGEFASMANVSVRTIRFYDRKNILKPSRVSESGIRYYSDEDFARLQQILLLKYLGFSLADIREMTIQNENSGFLKSSLKLQKKLVEDKIEQLQIVSRTIDETALALQENREIDWSSMMELIHSMGMEQSLKTQYQNASNISARISLHTLYSGNKQGWFPWIYEKCAIKPGDRILEIGCGDGSFWLENLTSVPDKVQIVLSDKSDGMLRDAARRIGADDPRFSCASFDCVDIPYKDDQFDLVIANHVLFYCSDIDEACREIKRVLKPGGHLICSTYGSDHMKEINALVTAFDDRIVLSGEQLFLRFGRENGADILSRCFSDITWHSYEDFLFVTKTDPLVSYVLSCHGNQNQFILDRYKEFRSHVSRSIGKGLKITKDAGIFLCKNS